MNKILVYLLLTGIINGYTQSVDQELRAPDGSSYLVGPISKKALLQDPYASWFQSGYKAASITQEEREKLEVLLPNVQILVFLGTWCGDSKREVPAFLKILDASGFPSDQLKIISLDRAKERYKQSPGGEEWGLNIIRVPTFIFLRNGREMNRIVEKPKRTLVQDMLTILTDQEYHPHYEMVSGTK
ncbi:thioredoxin family protein [Muriicola sp.]|uniref:thioredoxin family protein n=1 Tax=Muriicola sp. TaxID=2020856 RepID=UPI003C784032